MQTVLPVGSVTNAMRGKRLLEKHGVRAYIRKLSAENEHGCGYGLWIQGDVPQAANLLRAHGVAVLNKQGRDAP